MRIYFFEWNKTNPMHVHWIWCVQCPRPAGPSAWDKHQIQASALDLSYFTSKSKCKFINLIDTRQKNKIICSCSWKIIRAFYKISLRLTINRHKWLPHDHLFCFVFIFIMWTKLWSEVRAPNKLLFYTDSTSSMPTWNKTPGIWSSDW